MFEIEIASCDVPCAAIVAGANVLAIVTFGRFTTVSVAVAGPGLVEPCVVESAPVGIVFTYAPATSLVTFTVTVHVAPAPRLPPESATFVSPALALTVPAPQVVDAFGVGATLTPAGSASVNCMPESAMDPGAVFAIVMVSAEVPCRWIVAGENALLMVTPGAMTLRSAVAAPALLAP